MQLPSPSHQNSDGDSEASSPEYLFLHTKSSALQMLPSSNTDSQKSISTPNPSILQNIRRHPKITAWAVGLATAFLLSGYDSAIVNTVPSVTQFQKDFGEQYGANPSNYIIPSLWLSLWSASACIGQITGSLMSGPWQNRAGRKWPLAIGTIVSAVAVAIVYTSYLPRNIGARRGMFLIGETVQGIAIGVITTTARTYISETTPPCLRGSALALLPTFTMVGELVGSITIFMSSGGDNSNSYLVTFNSMWPFSAVVFLIALFVPESPTFLTRTGRVLDAHSSLQKLYTVDQDCGQLLKEMQGSLELEKQRGRQASYWECFREGNLRRTMIVAFASLMPALFGLPLLSHASYFLQLIGMKESTSLLILILGVSLGLVANAASVFVASCVGRRRLILSTLSVATLLWLGIGIAGCWSGMVSAWYTAITMVVITVVCGVGVWPASYIVCGETSSLRLRANTQGIGSLGSQGSTILLSFVLPYLYNKDAGNLGAKTGFIFCALCLVMVVLAWWTIPEMKGRTSDEIDQMFNLGLPARRFRHWVGRERI
ncbi:MFS general substrate transporter [Penicillium hispanicum]|uniref:MFS general substrate transporter n=1 Tax=Penicillium hispanicum TaxID=1080232 RepID=UPI0025414582|nr:MFS general substrate transporter [Penicillium hispanicum]KAJ5585219.1 MFS general substrate transporter [Penicillium hispanicum]